MRKLISYINEASKVLSNKQLHNVFNNPAIDLNDTMSKIIDLYCADGGEILYECQDHVLPNIVDEYKVDTAVIHVEETDITFQIDVYKMINAENRYVIYIQGETIIIIIGKEMKTIQESILLSEAIENAENTELYKYIEEKIKESIETGKPFDDCIDEGIFGSILGGLTGATVGPSIMKAVCKALGIDERGALGSLMTSRAVMAAVGGTLGYKI